MLASKEINEPVLKLGRNSTISSLQQDTPPKCKTNWLILAKNKQTNKQKVPSCTHWGDLPYYMEFVSNQMIRCSKCQALG